MADCRVQETPDRELQDRLGQSASKQCDPLSGLESSSYAQPSSEEARELHELMLQVVDQKVTEIDGEKLVNIKDTEVSLLARWQGEEGKLTMGRSRPCN